MRQKKSRCRLANCLLLFAIAAGIGAGCAAPSYKAYSTAPPKPTDYPIPAYTPEQRIPRPCKLIGTVSIEAGKFTVFGGSAGAQLAEILSYAHEKGADAVRFVAVQKPDFLNPNYRMAANLLRYADTWEALTNREFETYFQTNRANLDPIEGVWHSTGSAHLAVGIMKNNAQPGRDFIGLLLSQRNLAWTRGMKKMDIHRGPTPGSYVLTFYMDDFAPREIPVMLTDKREFAIKFRNADDEELLFFIKDLNAFTGQ
ncbi:MAG TPA: hypothetical protein VN625_03335 [Desulfuromonadaceae bacterium]|nr:hypothetical protein [Desulfuromonadaceae bacterium]